MGKKVAEVETYECAAGNEDRARPARFRLITQVPTMNYCKHVPSAISRQNHRRSCKEITSPNIGGDKARPVGKSQLCQAEPWRIKLVQESKVRGFMWIWFILDSELSSRKQVVYYSQSLRVSTPVSHLPYKHQPYLDKLQELGKTMGNKYLVHKQH
jgi:hypothetical protein